MVCDEKSNRSDAELARLAAEGDAAAFDEIYSRHRSFVYSIAVRMTGNLADAEDLTQDSFVSVLRRIGSFRGEASFSTWLYRVAVNQVKMHFRRRKSRPEDQTSDGELPEFGPNPARRDDYQRIIDRLAIDEAMRTLPRGYQTAFNLYDLEGYKHKEIALLLGCSEGTSKSQLHHARISLRKLLSTRSHALQT
jgi:RNA polymerase sigma-70 factor (ECF subfamily)